MRDKYTVIGKIIDSKFVVGNKKVCIKRRPGAFRRPKHLSETGVYFAAF